MKKVLLWTVQYVLAALLFVGQDAIGQQTLYKIPGTVSAKSLIRNLDDSIDIVYNTYENPSFLYVNRSSNQVVEAALQS